MRLGDHWLGIATLIANILVNDELAAN